MENKGEKAQCKQKKQNKENSHQKWKDYRKIFWLKMQQHKNSSGAAHELIVRIFKRQLWWTETFANASVI